MPKTKIFIENEAVPPSGDALRNDFAEILRTEGVNFKGFGILPKLVMLDTCLSLEAKAIYAYFCSFTGGGQTAFPGREKILHDLKMSKDSYYRHYHQLLEQGYVTVQRVGQNERFARNVYTLVSTPERMSIPESHRQESLIRAQGLKAGGYGFIPKAVMEDPRISVKAKGLYGYFCAFTGAGNEACPRRELILHHLDISVNSYTKYLKELKQLNYLEIRQRFVNGRLSVNDYYVVDRPDEENAQQTRQIEAQCTKNQDMAQYHKIQDIAPQQEPQDPLLYHKKQDIRKPDITKQYLINQDTNKNKLNNNSLEQQQSNQREDVIRLLTTREQFCRTVYPEADVPQYSPEELQYRQEAAAILLDGKRFPVEWTKDRDRIKAIVRFLLTADYLEQTSIYAKFDNGEKQQKLFCQMTDALIRMLTGKGSKALKATPAQILEKFNDRIKIVKGDIYLEDVIEPVRDAFMALEHPEEIRNLRAYLERCLWNQLISAAPN